jgi:hypothetical protein
MRINAIAIALLLSCTVSAESVTTVEKTQEICSAAATLFASGQYDRAYQSMMPYWPLPKEELQNLGYQSKAQLEMLGQRFGKSLGAEYVETMTAGDSLVRHIFLIKHEKHALKFSCAFYKPKGSWLVNSILWDDKIHTLIGVGS